MSLLSFNEPGQKELLSALSGVKKHFIYAGAFSAAVNLLQLVPIMYMLQVYDRVMRSGSYSTLDVLTILMVALVIALDGFDCVRSRFQPAASDKIDLTLRQSNFNNTVKLTLLQHTRTLNIQ